MLELYVSFSRYLFIILAIGFFYSCIRLDNSIKNNNEIKTSYYFRLQRILILSGHFVGYVILLVYYNSIECLILYIEQVIFFMVIWFIIDKVYKDSNLLLWNISLYLISISFVILARLEFGIGIRQFKMAVVGYIVALLTPIIFKKLNFLHKLNILYVLMSFGLLFMTNSTINGAENWFSIGTFSFQPSELVKILFVFFIAGILTYYMDIKGIIISGIITALLMLLLVDQKDLGTTLIFYVVFLCIIYIYSNNYLYFFGGLGAGIICSIIAYNFFYHVRVRVEAWMNPWEDITDKGHQIAQSLFAIGSGGWLGAGLNNGMPKKIPVVTTDFIFSALCEEFGNIFSIIIILIFIIFTVNILNTNKHVKNDFYFLISIGLGLTIAFQSFLIIGGVTKIIPLTGVTLPFVSYGGTSIIVSCLMLGIIQGIYIKKDFKDDGDKNE